MHQSRQLVPRQRLYQYVHMVRHDAPGKQAVATPVEMEERIFDKAGDTCLPQVALAITRAKERYQATTPLRGDIRTPAPLKFQLRQNLGRQRVGEAERDHLKATRPIKVRQVVPRAPRLEVAFIGRTGDGRDARDPRNGVHVPSAGLRSSS